MSSCFNKSNYEIVNEDSSDSFDSSDTFDSLLDDVSEYINDNEDGNIWRRLGRKIINFLYFLIHREPMI